MKKLLLALLLVSIFSAPSYATQFKARTTIKEVWYDNITKNYCIEFIKHGEGFVWGIPAKKENIKRTNTMINKYLNKKAIVFFNDNNTPKNIDDDVIEGFKIIK